MDYVEPILRQSAYFDENYMFVDSGVYNKMCGTFYGQATESAIKARIAIYAGSSGDSLTIVYLVNGLDANLRLGTAITGTIPAWNWSLTSQNFNNVYNEIWHYKYQTPTSLSNVNPVITVFSSIDDLLLAVTNDTPATAPIIYVPIHSTLSGPESAASGETVNVSVSFPDGYIYQEKGVSIYNKDGVIPFTYTDGTLSFTMP